MKKLLVLFGLMFAIFACSNDCMNVDVPQKNSNKNNQSNTDEPEKRFTTLQDVVDNANAGDEIDLSDYELTSYTATVNKKLTIKNGSLSGANLTVTSENVKLEKLADLSVTSSSRLTINDSKLSSLLIGGNGETSRSRTSEAQTSLAMVTVTDSEIENVELNGFNSQLNITDTVTQIDDILISTKAKVILEAGSYDGMKDPTVTNGGEAVRVDMTKDTQLSVLSIYSSPQKLEYNIGDKIDLTGLTVMGTYSTDVETFKSGGWKSEGEDTITKYEEYEKDYTVEYDFSTAGVSIVTVTSTKYPEIKCNFHVFVKELQNSGTSQPEKEEIEITKIELRSFGTPKTLYKVGEKLDLSCYQVVGTYNGFEINLQYTSDPANGTVLEKDVVVKFYYANQEIGKGISIKVTQPYTVKFYDGIDSSKPLYTTEAVDGELLKLPSDPNRENYTFAGWYIGDKKVTSESIVESNLELIAQWTADGYIITYNLNGGTNASDNPAGYNVENATITLADATKTGYTFDGWYTDEACTETNKVTEIKTGSTGNLTLYAKWNANTDTAYTVKHYQQNANDDDYTLVDADTETKKGTTDEDTSAQAKTYDGFTAQEVEQEKIAADGSTVVEIYYDRKEITLTLNLDGGEGDESISGKYGATVTNPTTPTKSGYQFTRWNPELPTTFPAEDKTYTAQWAEAKTNAYYVNSSIGSDDYSGTSSSPFKTVQKAVTAINEKNDPSTEFTIYLDGEFTLSNQIEISKKIKITTSKTASIIRHNDFTYDNLIEVSSGGELTLANVTIDGNQVENDYSGIYVEGTLNLNDKATIQNCTASEGGGVQVADGGTFNMNSGAKIQNCEAFFGGGVIIYGNGEFKMSGGSITNCKAQESYGGGVLVYYTEKTDTAGNVSYIPGKFNMSGGTISGCEAGYGGAVCLDHGTFTMSGGSITKNSATSTSQSALGGGVYVADGEFNMSDTASIDDCNALSDNNDSRYGGGVYLAGGSFNMTGGSITNCKVTGYNDYGGGVYISSGEFTMSGGTISWSSDDYCAERGGGVYVAGGNFNMSESAKIEGCKTYSLGGGVYQAGGKFTMSENAVISGCEAVITVNSSESYGGGVYQNAGEFTMSGGTISGCKVYNSTTKTDVKSYGGGVYQNAGTFEMTGGTISGCTAEQGGGVYKYSGVFKMQGGTIGGGEETLGCTANQGGGVYLGSLGSSSISSGIISNCSAKQGGGVYYNGDSNNTFTMYNGEISKCTAEQGGGVYVNNGEFKMSGSAKIDKCEASERGGGVYQNGGRFEIFKNTDGTNNVIISSNTAKSGGGVCVYTGTFSMNSGSISGNKVKSDSAQGGGVLVIGNFFMYDGNITNNELEYERIDNTLTSGGAGVAVSLKGGNNGALQKGEFTMNGGEISGNTITDNYNNAKGEDLFVISGGTFTHNGGTINNDKIHNANNQ